MRRVREIVHHEYVRRSLVWAGLVVGSSILLEGLISTTAWVYVMLLLVAAMWLESWIASLDNSESDESETRVGQWAGPLAAVMLVGLAVVMRLLLDW